MSNLSCDVIQDLLPLYIDDACSQQSTELVAEHLSNCGVCKAQLDSMSNDTLISHMPETEQQNVHAIKSLAKIWRRSKWFSWIKGVTFSTILFVIIFCLYMLLTEWKMIAVSADKFEVSHVYQLSDGSISYWLKAKDGYKVTKIEQTFDSKGNLYIVAYRPIIKRKADVTSGLHNYIYRTELQSIKSIDVEDLLNSVEGHDDRRLIIDSNNVNDHRYNINLNEQQDSVFSTPTTGIYYGTVEKSIVIWKEGMSLSPAGKELEDYWLDKNKEQQTVQMETVKE